ncbi:MAG TPA: PEP-CTERM sorting domain-containing protein, partial [Phycisphaerae bacterium]|nr:PEP-CTERM sorting domain-containing protein [Phycisphaerae bacterium]
RNGAIFNNLSAGTFDIESNADLEWDGGSRPTFNNAGSFVKSGGGVTTVAFAFSNSGTVEAQAGSLQLTGGFTQTDGQTVLSGGALNVTGAGIDLQGGVIAGAGDIFGNVFNTAGTVAPGGSAGTLGISATYTQSSGGVLAIELGGTEAGQFDVLNVTGDANLAGTLALGLIGGYDPNYGDSFQVLTAAAVIGVFDTIDGWRVSNDMSLATLYHLGDVTVMATLPGDADADLDVDLDDLTLLGTFYNTVDGMSWGNGDFDGDGDVDLDDLTIMGAFYNQAPELAGSTPLIPEPGTLALLATGALALLRRRRKS